MRSLALGRATTESFRPRRGGPTVRIGWEARNFGWVVPRAPSPWGEGWGEGDSDDRKIESYLFSSGSIRATDEDIFAPEIDTA